VYATFGGIKWDYAALMFVTGFLITIAGQLLTYHVIAKLGRRSVIIIAMAMLLSVGAIIMGYESVTTMLQAYPDKYLTHTSICGGDASV
jgi:MFS family permease